MMRETRTLLMGAILLVGTLAFAPALCQADDDPTTEDNPYARSGFYIGLAGSLGVDAALEDKLEKAVTNTLMTSVGTNVDEKIGLNARIGYRFHPRIAGEAQFEWITEAGISFKGVPFGKDAIKLERWTYTANAKAYLGTGIVQPFLLVGLGLMSAQLKGDVIADLEDDPLVFSVSETKEAFAARFGGGIEIYATDYVVINLDASYVLPTGALDDFDYISIGWGVMVRF